MNRSKTSNKGILFVVSAPSGAGKTTLVQAVLKKNRSLHKTISHTTRKPRPRERHGKDYYFITPAYFRRMIARKEFIEWAKVYGQFYGTSKSTIEEGLKKGKDLILVIESKGAKAIRKKFRSARFIIILPPNLKELEKRLSGRGGEKHTAIQRRLKAAKKEIRSMAWYDHTVVNDRLPKARKKLLSLIRAARRRS